MLYLPDTVQAGQRCSIFPTQFKRANDALSAQHSSSGPTMLYLPDTVQAGQRCSICPTQFKRANDALSSRYGSNGPTMLYLPDSTLIRTVQRTTTSPESIHHHHHPRLQSRHPRAPATREGITEQLIFLDRNQAARSSPS